MPDQTPIITDAAPSFDEDQARRRRSYVILMVVHIVGFALSYPLYLWQPWAGVAAVIATGALPWVAVVLANGGPRHSSGTRAPGPSVHVRRLTVHSLAATSEATTRICSPRASGASD